MRARVGVRVTHGVRFARPRLTVGKDRGIETRHHMLHEWSHLMRRKALELGLGYRFRVRFGSGFGCRVGCSIQFYNVMGERHPKTRCRGSEGTISLYI